MFWCSTAALNPLLQMLQRRFFSCALFNAHFSHISNFASIELMKFIPFFLIGFEKWMLPIVSCHRLRKKPPQIKVYFCVCLYENLLKSTSKMPSGLTLLNVECTREKSSLRFFLMWRRCASRSCNYIMWVSVIITNEDHKELSLVCIMGYDNGSLCIWK